MTSPRLGNRERRCEHEAPASVEEQGADEDAQPPDRCRCRDVDSTRDANSNVVPVDAGGRELTEHPPPLFWGQRPCWTAPGRSVAALLGQRVTLARSPSSRRNASSQPVDGCHAASVARRPSHHRTATVRSQRGAVRGRPESARVSRWRRAASGESSSHRARTGTSAAPRPGLGRRAGHDVRTRTRRGSRARTRCPSRSCR